MSGDRIPAEMTVADVLARWPKTAVVFQRHNMACLGCPVSPYCQIRDAAAAYELPLEQLISELELVIAN